MTNTLLILDLDETLIHATTTPLPCEHDFVVASYFVYKRPWVDQFIAFCFAHFDVAVWTSSTEPYAQAVIANLFNEPKALKFIFSRRKCTRRFDFETHDDTYIKDLRKIKKRGYTLEKTLIIDDTREKLCRNYGNLIHIDEWTGNATDRELLHIQPYLLSLKGAENMRKIEKRSWRRLRHQDVPQNPNVG
ncbi:hypothetical protein IGB42_00423 [Andreprevotia sp. IGB-42]|uniref:HAD family hydrolase n=1 Tax=Andreprevotia sp. IGB-42 TaxID=2497473 RepID=UPI00135B5DA8|nr:HAD family hydrolase [Andreprevotia sp. IGB-42]KAF0815342.1 hypothetical protein IGB42_00423 [Andreprevotia sp. IGB-42]